MMSDVKVSNKAAQSRVVTLTFNQIPLAVNKKLPSPTDMSSDWDNLQNVYQCTKFEVVAQVLGDKHTN